MSEKSKSEANTRRRLVVARDTERRAELGALIKHPSTTDQVRAAAQRELQRQPRDASATRVRNRDAPDGGAVDLAADYVLVTATRGEPS